jgi:hypothetical protein
MDEGGYLGWTDPMFGGSPHEDLPRLSQRPHPTAALQSRDCKIPFLAELRRNLLKRDIRGLRCEPSEFIHFCQTHWSGGPSWHILDLLGNPYLAFYRHKKPFVFSHRDISLVVE